MQIYIGGESGLVPLDEMSVVTAPYEVDGRVIGTLGVIGPTRMAYERVIPIVDMTAKLLSNALTQQLTTEPDAHAARRRDGRRRAASERGADRGVSTTRWVAATRRR